MSTLKAAIKKAINDHHPMYKATKVWNVKVDDGWHKEKGTMWIEVAVRKRPIKKPQKPIS